MSLRRMFHHKKGVIPGLLAAALLAPALAHAFEPFVVRDIRVEGIQRTDAGTVFGYLPVKVGEKFTDEEATEAVRRLYGTGFFSDVQIQTDNNVVVVVVQERPTIASISFNGMREFDSKAITKSLAQVGFGEGRIFDQSMLERAEYELKEQYLAKGKYGVEVTATVTPLPRNRVGVSFDVFEGEVAKIREIRVVGSKAFSEGELLDQFDLTTPGWLTWYTNTDKYSREKLEGDIERLRSFYLDQGYLEFTVEPPQVTISPDRKDIYITITVHEGEPYKVREVKLAGNLMGLDSEINNLVEIKPGEVFSAAKANNSAKAITDYLGDLGYAFANVNPNPQLDRAKHEADVTFYVDPSRRVYVRRIQIGGNTRTRDEVVRREMRQQEAAWYDAGDIKVSRDRVDRLGYFNEVNVKTDPVPGSPDQVDVNVDVKEKPTGIINLGVGYGSSEKAILSAGISEDNVFGSGTNLTLQLNTSKTNRAVVLSHTDPYFTKDGISRTTSAYYRVTEPWDNNDGDYRVKAMGLGMNFGVPISEYDRIFLGGTFERNQIDLYNNSPQAYRDFVDQYGDSTNALIFNTGWSKDTRDSALAPTKGAYTRLKGDFSTMDLKYYLLTAQQQYYLPLGRSYTLALNGMIDYGRSYGGLDYPVIKNVYAGGIGTVRGYEGASLGPRDRLTGDYIGGSRRMVANAQLYLPFPGASKDRTLRWFVFTDAGQVAAGSGMSCTAGKPGSEVEDPCGWRFSAGIGLSWQSPLGPLQLSYARPLNSKSGDDTQAFQFQIGTGF
ncbi:outer membrane protein assembly factor BamA [Bordetella bronchiseptica]|uniref:Outer membrane protein assembly factor BamA n=1 Tax=Bordetella bronchiseptica (strain ATCC BAA-588 / NCTC 13252 / RB50) TaxID=257310 RepID=A0A0H3LT90_BORBR|nr:outer membrane protein assembly factor BamA [Bordetella bronchiseptica]AMG88856.1 outer membrane protein assembly factor BamA [Bordetella bronchiseptica]AWP80149.1 outer membrane protein assembly factor BamA [Bordetella bronchiseptica]AWP84951.1 outer membrane protein assembly factor BamA [Bordetella bronchiseptica]AWQ10526.1 outer membrane protein assembly factor BamA [Bordetella bronchiseptica]AXT89170.1 outer membrane protein assembly factor BamA [Bordetella bronchiseptica]